MSMSNKKTELLRGIEGEEPSYKLDANLQKKNKEIS